MKVTLVNGWHDDNKGDSGIVNATLSLIFSSCHNAKCSIVSTFTENNPNFYNAHRHLLTQFPELDIISSPLPEYRGKLFFWVVKLLSALFFISIGYKKYNKTFNVIAKSELVISKGGHIFYNVRSHPRDLMSLLRHLFPLIIARRFKVPFAIFSQSVGPFKGHFGAYLTKFVFNKAKVVFVREDISYDITTKIGVDPLKVYVIPDAAFYLKADVSERVKKILKEKSLKNDSFWAVTVRSWPPGNTREDQSKKNKYLDEMAKFLSKSVERGEVDQIAIVVHTIGPLVIEDDHIPSQLLYNKLLELGTEVSIIEDDLTPRELVGLYSMASLLIGTRFHSVIFSLAGGTPALAVSYFGPKAHGIMKLINMDFFCLNIESFNSAEALDRIVKLKQMDTTHIKKITEKFRDQLKLAMDELIR